jgi:eukaryotic-like serine/threonine-protein kinase
LKGNYHSPTEVRDKPALRGGSVVVVVTVRPGDRLDSRFEIEHSLGRGGMGEVWSAFDTATQRRVAIKVLLEKTARKPDLVARFEREARIAARVQSPYVCAHLHTGRSESGELYLVFELLSGESLADRLKREIELSFGELAPLIADVLEGLVAAHAVGVIHRDLKPANIYIEQLPDGSERAKILDFGVSKVLQEEGGIPNEQALTAMDATLGSFAYMAPEQVRGAATVDERSDIYAVGSVVFRSLVGKLPFDGLTANMLVSSKLEGEPPPLAQATGEQWPASIEAFVARCLAKPREERFASAGEALAALRAIMAKLARVTGGGVPVPERSSPRLPAPDQPITPESEYPPPPEHTVADS